MKQRRSHPIVTKMLKNESKQQNEDKIEENYGFKFGTTMNKRWTNRHSKL